MIVDSFIRIVLSLCVAVVLVGAIALMGINTYFEKPPINQVAAFRVEPATQAELELIRRIEEPPAQEQKPEPELPQFDRERDGFVQVEFEVTAEGRARDVRVVGAMPAGYFEEQAVAKIERLRFVPDRVDGEAVSSVRTQIVEFKYTPAAARASSSDRELSTTTGRP